MDNVKQLLLNAKLIAQAKTTLEKSKVVKSLFNHKHSIENSIS